MNFKNIFPKYRARVLSNGRVSSFRWGPIKWDSLKSPKGFIFAQYGKRPSFFVCRSEEEHPLFIMGQGWETKFKSKSLRVGVTRRPLNFNWIWRKGAKNASWTSA